MGQNQDSNLLVRNRRSVRNRSTQQREDKGPHPCDLGLAQRPEGAGVRNIGGGFWCSFWDVEVIDLFTLSPYYLQVTLGVACMLYLPSLSTSSLIPKKWIGMRLQLPSKTGWVTTENNWRPPAHFLPLASCLHSSSHLQQWEVVGL